MTEEEKAEKRKAYTKQYWKNNKAWLSVKNKKYHAANRDKIAKPDLLRK